MAKTNVSSKRRLKRIKSQPTELDSTFVFKIALYLILGSQWLFITSGDGSVQLPIPLGLLLGLLFARHEHFQIDRKIEYAVLLVAALVGFWAHIGLLLQT